MRVICYREGEDGATVGLQDHAKPWDMVLVHLHSNPGVECLWFSLSLEDLFMHVVIFNEKGR